jgi:uncharacterized protein (TIGR00661 family)
MASIVYAMCGEGRGHATRARAIVEAMRGRHQLTLFASDCAYDMLGVHYPTDDVHLVRIPGLRFGYSGPGRVDLMRTLWMAARFRWELNDLVEAILPELERARPDLIIADFEPIVPRAARRLGLPFVSFDHQHYLVVSDFSALPFAVRQEANLAGPFVRALYDWQQATIVSAFYRAPLKKAYRDTTWVGTLIRPEMLPIRPSHGRYLVAYMRRYASPETLSALTASGREVRVYGLGARASDGPLRFLDIDERRFIDDLAGCDAVVSTAGNQLVGEALFLSKPLLVMPEAMNFEQSVNAHFLEKSGVGWVERGQLTAPRLGAFLEALPDLRANIRPAAVWGNEAAVAALERQIGKPSRPAQPPRFFPTPPPVAARQWV